MRFFATMFTKPETVGLQRLERISGESQRYGSPRYGLYEANHLAGEGGRQIEVMVC
jgi:hypothetical protein